MAVQVYRCSHCGREVLVRLAVPLTEESIRRRIAEEMRPDATGEPAQPRLPDRLRDDIWVGLSGGRTPVPRNDLPAACPACGRDSLALARILEG